MIFKSEKLVIYLTLALGALLAISQFLFNRSLWLDESLLALNIISKNGFQLLKPLNDCQVAPILFLECEKAFSLLVPNSEYGLRLFPLISFGLSTFLFYKILKPTFKNTLPIIFALSLFVFNTTLIYYSSEVKQYITDILAIITIYYLILKNFESEKYKYFLLAIIGSTIIFLSNIAPIILSSAGLFLVYNSLAIKKRNIKPILLVGLIWAITFFIFYYFFIYNHPSKSSMIDYWTKKNAFVPNNLFSYDFYRFLGSKLKMIFTSLLPFGIIGQICLPTLLIVGIIRLVYEKNINTIILSFTPIILHLILSALKLYPFDLRLILYTTPLFIIVITYGFNYIVNQLSFKIAIRNIKLLTPLIPCFFILFVFISGFPRKHEEINESIKFIKSNIQINDKIYVYYGALGAFDYYNQTNQINLTNLIERGSINRDIKQEYIAELTKNGGSKWLLFSHSYEDEEQYIINKLNSIGCKQVKSFTSVGSSAYLYNIKSK